MKEQHQRFLEGLTRYERQCFLNAQPYERSPGRVDQANAAAARRQIVHFMEQFSNSICRLPSSQKDGRY